MHIFDENRVDAFGGDEHRCTGRSTVIALKNIATALKNPGLHVKIVDHHLSPRADEHLAHMILDYIERLAFKGFTITKDGNVFYLRFKHEDRRRVS